MAEISMHHQSTTQPAAYPGPVAPAQFPISPTGLPENSGLRDTATAEAPLPRPLWLQQFSISPIALPKHADPADTTVAAALTKISANGKVVYLHSAEALQGLWLERQLAELVCGDPQACLCSEVVGRLREQACAVLGFFDAQAGRIFVAQPSGTDRFARILHGAILAHEYQHSQGGDEAAAWICTDAYLRRNGYLLEIQNGALALRKAPNRDQRLTHPAPGLVEAVKARYKSDWHPRRIAALLGDNPNMRPDGTDTSRPAESPHQPQRHEQLTAQAVECYNQAIQLAAQLERTRRALVKAQAELTALTQRQKPTGFIGSIFLAFGFEGSAIAAARTQEKMLQEKKQHEQTEYKTALKNALGHICKLHRSDTPPRPTWFAKELWEAARKYQL